MLGLLFLLGHFACLKVSEWDIWSPLPLINRRPERCNASPAFPSMHTRPATLRTVDERRMKDRRQDDLQREVDSDRYERK